MVSKRNDKDYSLESFKRLILAVQKKYLQLAKERNPEFASSDAIMEVVAANIWMAEMEYMEGGQENENSH